MWGECSSAVSSYQQNYLISVPVSQLASEEMIHFACYARSVVYGTASPQYDFSHCDELFVMWCLDTRTQSSATATWSWSSLQWLCKWFRWRSNLQHPAANAIATKIYKECLKRLCLRDALDGTAMKVFWTHISENRSNGAKELADPTSCLVYYWLLARDMWKLLTEVVNPQNADIATMQFCFVSFYIP